MGIPHELGSISSAAALFQAVSEQQLWIARQGPCSLLVSLMTLGEPLMMLERDLAAEWIQEYNVGVSE